MSEYKPTKTLLLHLDNYAELFDHWFGGAFKNPVPGVYINGEETLRERLHPIFEGYKKELDFWQESGAKIESLADVNSPVYDYADNCVLSQADLWKGWGTVPSVPLVGRLIGEAYLRDAMVSQLRYFSRKRFQYQVTLDNWLNVSGDDRNSIDNRIQEILGPSVLQIMEFIDGPTFDMHLMHRTNGELTLEKYGDWRVYEYYRLTKKPYQA